MTAVLRSVVGRVLESSVTTGADVDISDTNSVEKRRRLPWLGPDAIVIAIALFIGWRLFLAPMVHPLEVQMAPPLHLATADGSMIDLQAQHGHTVFVDFFATWCGPCQQSLPLIEAYAAHHPEIRLITVDVGEPKATVRAFALAHKMQIVALDPKAHLADDWGVHGFPTIVGIDGDGHVRDTWFGYVPVLPQILADAEGRYRLERRDAKKAATASRDS
jgi:thiol-disulfide isomerase/thioredoxin